MVKEFFESALYHVLGTATTVSNSRSLGGGCINSCFRLESDVGVFFIKYHRAQYLDMFEKEYQGLQALRVQSQLTIPAPLGYGTVGDRSFLLMEFLEAGARSADYWEELGRGLAVLHRIKGERYGWQNNNYIGRLPQMNHWHRDWIPFFIDERLKPNVKNALDNGLMPQSAGIQFQTLFRRLHDLLSIEPPVLLHGDLWSGNVLTGTRGEPCLVDPAVYYGHREVELAFTTLFGGFDDKFYRAYDNELRLAPGYRQRFGIYNLYPLLVHLNLFGRGYLGSIQSTLNQFC